MFVLGGLCVVISYAWFKYCPPIPQDPSFHAFADQRPCCAIPHAANVLSNVPFFLVGLLGFLTSHKIEIGSPLFMFYLGSILTAFGSAYYHWHPTHATLVYDRLPMTLCTTAAFLFVLQPILSSSLFSTLLYSSGLGSVWYWKCYDDLRWYAWVQYFPVLLLPILCGLYVSAPPFLGTAVFWYLLARLVEFYDHRVFLDTARFISGHTLKHLLAAVSMYYLHLMYQLTDGLLQ